MAKPYVPGGTLRYAHKFTRTGDPDPYYVTFAAKVNTGEVDLQAVTNAIHTAAKTMHNSIGHAVDTMRSTTARLMLATDGDEAVAITLGDQTGASTASPLPSNCAWLVHKYTGLAGRANQGRVYYPGPPESAVDILGNISNDQFGFMNSGLATYLTAINNIAAIDTMVLVHYPRVGNIAPEPTPVTSLLLDPRIATQRNRMR
jgi:hypothetical protein